MTNVAYHIPQAPCIIVQKFDNILIETCNDCEDERREKDDDQLLAFIYQRL